MKVSTLVTETSIILMIDGKTYSITKAHANYDQIKQRVIKKDYTNIQTLIDIGSYLATKSNGRVRVENGVVYYDDEVLHNSLTTRILTMLNEGFDISPMVKFLENLLLNPSKRAVDELYGFLEACSLPITDDGHFLAYKKVRRNESGDLVDIYSGKNINNVGSEVSMARFKVDDEKNHTCSQGLHFCSQTYLPHFGTNSGSVVVILKINPADVVSIPVDYNNAKGRCCRYVVVDEYEYSDYEKAFTTSVDTRYPEPKADKSVSDTSYEAGYAAGSAKANRHNKKGEGQITKRSDSEFDKGYYNGYTATRTVKTNPAPKTHNRGPDGRFIKKETSTPESGRTKLEAKPIEVHQFTRNSVTGLMEKKQPNRGPDGRFIKK